MVLTRAQQKRKAAGEPIFTAPRPRRQKRDASRTNIDTLPDELLLQIVDCIGEQGGHHQSLHSLSLVNRRFDRIAASGLYECVEFRDDNTHAPYLYLRTVLRAPDLARKTTCLYWMTDRTPIGGSLLIAASDRTGTLAHSNIENWLQDIQSGRRDAYIATLLCLLPRLETFDIDTENAWLSKSLPVYTLPLLQCAQKELKDGLHQFEHLKHLTIQYSSLSSSQVSALFLLHLSTLELISGESTQEEFDAACQSWAVNDAAWACAPFTSSITRLRIEGTLPWQVVDKLISSCRSLEEFRFEGYIWLTLQPQWFRGVRRALEPHRQSLRKLSFNHSECDNGPTVAAALAGQLGDLSSFPLLDTFAGPLSLLLCASETTGQDQLRAVAQTLPDHIKHLLLVVGPGWNPGSLIDPRDTHKVFTQLQRLYVRHMTLTVADPPVGFLDLIEYFEPTPVEFSFVLDFWHTSPSKGE